MRVTLVIPTPALPCGVFEYTNALVEHLHCAREATVLSGSHSAILDQLKSDNVTDILHLQFGYYLYPLEFLAQILELARSKGWPSIITMHGFRPDMISHHDIIRHDRIPLIVHSNSMKQGLCACGIAGERIHVLAMPCPNPLPLCYSQQQNRIGYFGFLLPHKGLLELCCALELLLPTHPDFKATILSARAPFGVSGEYAAAVAHALAAKHLRERVDWQTCFLSEKQILTELGRCAVTVLPYQEHTEVGASYAACVALASGRPLITTKASFFENLDCVADQTASNRPAELARAIKAMLDDPARQATYAAQARNYAARNTWANSAAAHQKLYAHLLGYL